MINDVLQLPLIFVIFVAIGIIAIIYIVTALIFYVYDLLENKIYKNIYKKRRENINLTCEVSSLKIENEELEKIISRYEKIIKDEKLDRKYEKVEL